MQLFGKRIYYDKLTGNVIKITNDMMGEGIQQLTPAQEVEIHTALYERIPTSFSFIQLEYGEYAHEFMDGTPTHYNANTEELTWTWHNPQAVEERKTLEQEIAELKFEKDQMKADNLMLMEAVFDLYAMIAVQQGA